ncbi:hypothetical protein [Brevundimonas sp. CEF1]|uniref:hypothetical protein n=1 Tax=Brevundimonas sp. CEF1 TaxID=3442642 RepID=UPI003F50FA41
MTDAKHEAPAEGAGERERLADAYIAGAMSVHEYWTENPGEAPRGDPEFDEAAGDYAYSILSDLRARSSAPEAREGEAVAWIEAGDLEHVSEGHPLTTTLFPYAKGEAALALYTHPAAPSADKLRIAVEALEYIDGRKSIAPVWVQQRVRSALAALKAEGAK